MPARLIFPDRHDIPSRFRSLIFDYNRLRVILAPTLVDSFLYKVNETAAGVTKVHCTRQDLRK